MDQPISDPMRAILHEIIEQIYAISDEQLAEIRNLASSRTDQALRDYLVNLQLLPLLRICSYLDGSKHLEGYPQLTISLQESSASIITEQLSWLISEVESDISDGWEAKQLRGETQK